MSSTLNSTFTFTAAADLRGKQFLGVTVAGALPTGPGTLAGIIQSKPNTGEFGAAVYFGESEARAGDTIAKGDRLTYTTSGFVACTSGGISIGRALAACASGGIFRGLFDFIAPTTVGSW